MEWIIFSTYVVILLLLIYYFNNKIGKNSSIIVLAFGMAIFSTLILSINSTDNINYISIFRQIHVSSLKDFFHSNNQNVELGFLFYGFLFKSLGFSYLGYLFVLLFISNSLIIKFFVDRGYVIGVVMLFIVLGLYKQETNIVRQMVALSFGLYSLQYLFQKKYFKFLCLVFLGFSIHASVLVFLIIPFIIKIDYKYLVLFWIFTLIIAFGGIFDPTDYITAVFQKLHINIYATYIENNSSIGNKELVFNPMINLVSFITLFVNRRFIKSEDNLYKIFLLGVSIDNLKLFIPAFARLSMYFIVLFPLIISMLLYNFKYRYKYVFIGFQCIIVLYYLYITMYAYPMSGYYTDSYKLSDMFRL